MYENSSTPPNRRKLTDILAGQTNDIRQQWDTTQAAAEFVPLPAGQYECHVQSAELFNAKTGTPGVKIQFRVCEGEHVGRCLFADAWLTPAALPAAKRDLAKLGIVQLEQLETGSVPPGRIRCKVRVALRADDSGGSLNKVKGFDVLGIDADATVDADFPPGVAAAAELLLQEEGHADTAKPEADTSPSASAPPIPDAVTTPPAREYDPDESAGDASFDPAQLDPEAAGGAA